MTATPSRGSHHANSSASASSIGSDNYTVLSGLKAGEAVVTKGSFFLRAEMLRNAPGGLIEESRLRKEAGRHSNGFRTISYLGSTAERVEE